MSPNNENNTEDLDSTKADAIAEAKQAEEDALKVYNQYLTDLEVFGHQPTSRTHVPIGSLAGVPKWALFPERILTVYKIDKQEVSEWEKESEKDVLSISEVAEVSISKAKSILSKLRTEGYSVSKDVESIDDEIELLYFRKNHGFTAVIARVFLAIMADIFCAIKVFLTGKAPREAMAQLRNSVLIGKLVLSTRFGSQPTR